MSIRRWALWVALLGVLAWPLAGRAQTNKPHRVAVVLNGNDADSMSYHAAFLEGLRGLGYVVGTNLILDLRNTNGDSTRLPAAVDEAIAFKPDVLVGWEQIAQVMRTKTTSIPIVLTGGIDPVRAGLAQSLARPGMNVTGVAQLNYLLPDKHIQIIREIKPRLARVGQLVDTSVTGCKLVEEQTRESANRVGASFVPYYVQTRGEIENAFAKMEKERPDVLLPCPLGRSAQLQGSSH